MRRLRVLGRAALAALGALASACLPNDTRTPPGSVLVNVVSDGVAAKGIPATATTDGWSITFERVLVSLGNVSLDGDSCDVYSDSGYTRLFDMKVGGMQKVAVIYALGHCEVGFRVASPNVDTVLGAGTTDADKTRMRTPGSDAFNDQAGTSIYVKGQATRGDATESFAWSFRYRARYDRCAITPALSGPAMPDPGIELVSKGAQSLLVEVSPGVLFADQLNTTVARHRFQVFADADTITGNGDGVVTLDELQRVPLDQAGFADLAITSDAGAFTGVDDFIGDADLVIRPEMPFDGGVRSSLGDYLYAVLFPGMIRYDGSGSCSVHLTSRGVGG